MPPYPNNNYNKPLQPFASNLRKTMTKAEACLWKFALKAGKMKGYTFKRQRPILRFIADFCCLELMLVIEVDGITHQWAETQAKDIVKTSALEQAGFTVMRFDDDEVVENIDNVIYFIEEWIERKEALMGGRGKEDVHLWV